MVIVEYKNLVFIWPKEQSNRKDIRRVRAEISLYIGAFGFLFWPDS